MFGILRTLLAINVILLHIFGIPALGNYSVHFFFILSGFLMTYVMCENYHFDARGIKLFWVNRFLRLYPIYWLLLLICIIVIVIFPEAPRSSLINMPISVKDWFYNLTIIYPDRIPTRIKPKLLPTSWALTNEIFFYVFISLGVSKTKSRTVVWLVLSIIYYLITYFYFNLDNYRYGAILAASLPFAIGAVLYWVKEMKIFRVNLFVIIIAYILFFLNAYFLSREGFLIKQCSIYLNFVIGAFIIISLFNLQIEDGKIKRIDSYIGRYSYVFYLAHELVLILYLLIFNNFGLSVENLKLKSIAFVPYFFLLLLISFIIVHLVDIKIDLLKNRFKK